MYRFFKHELRHLSFLVEGLDPGNQCPSCPKVYLAINYHFEVVYLFSGWWKSSVCIRCIVWTTTKEISGSQL